MGPLYAVALGTGCRLGELLGLAWTDLSADGASLTVRRALAESGRVADDKGHRHTAWSLAEPKTRRSRRTIMVPTFVREALRRQKAAQAVRRLAAGTAWQDQADLMFTDALGNPMRPDAVSRVFHETATRLGLQPIRFHDLRHSAASLIAMIAVDSVPRLSAALSPRHRGVWHPLGPNAIDQRLGARRVMTSPHDRGYRHATMDYGPACPS
jgi:integrase